MSDVLTPIEINVKASLNVDTVNQDVKRFGDTNADVNQNTGIEREGGVTNIYEAETTFPEAGFYFETENGQQLAAVASGASRTIKVDGVAVGTVSAYGVESRADIKGVDDVALTGDGTLMTMKLSGGTVTITENTLAGVQTASRSVTFTNLGALAQYFTSISFVRYEPMHYVDSQEFALRLGEQVVILKESTPTQTFPFIGAAVNPLGAANLISSSASFNGFLIVAGQNGRVASFDGIAWRNYDGSGSGLGPYNNGFLAGEQIELMVVYRSFLVLSGSKAGNGKIGSWDGSNWKNYDGSGTGSGPFNGTTVLLGQAVKAMTVFGNFLVVGGTIGRTGSWDGTAWKNSDGTGTGTGPFNNGAALLGAQDVVTACQYSTFLIVGGASGRVASWDGSNWKNYDASGTGTGPFNNGVVLGASVVNISIAYSTFLVVASDSGRVGSWDGSQWKNYNGTGTGTGPFNNATAVGAGGIFSVILFPTNLVLAGASGRIGSWDGSNWKNYDGTGSGTGVFNNGTIIGANTINSMAVYAGLLFVVSGAAARVNYITSGNVVGPFYSEGANFIANLLTGQSLVTYLYVFRYQSNGLYLINLTGNTLSIAYILNNATNAVVTVNCRYAFPQTSGGFTRHIISERPRFSGTNVFAVSVVGFVSFTLGSYTSTQQYPATGLVLSSILAATSSSLSGFNYTDFCFKLTASATDVYTGYFPIPQQAPPSVLMPFYQGNTPTNINGYGKLNNVYGLAPSVPVEFRVVWTNGEQVTLSVALLDGLASDCLGVLLTNVGEFDPSYTPHLVGDNTILYQAAGVFKVVKIGTNLTDTIQKVSQRLYKLNTVSPYNLYDAQTNSLALGSPDYNGRMIFSSTAVPSAAATPVASLIQNDGGITSFVNSIDVGDKLVFITGVGSANLQVFGIRLPAQASIQQGYAVDTFISDVYSFSTLSSGLETVLASRANTLYLINTALPVAIGGAYAPKTVSFPGITVVLTDNLEVYEPANELFGSYVAFQLFGQLYLFDGEWIYQTGLSNGFLDTPYRLAPADGLQFIAVSPNKAYFLSSFDNALFEFSGGRSLSKAKRMNNQEAILNGVWSVKDNTLLLQTTNTLLWIRDDVATLNDKKAAQLGTGLRLYDTTDGIILGNNSGKWQYSFEALPGSTVVPFAWSSAFFGIEGNQQSIVKSWVATIKADVGVTGFVSLDSFDEDSAYQQRESFTITKAMFNSLGYARLRIAPQYQRSLGMQFTLTTSQKILLLDLTALVEGDISGVPNPNRSL